MMALTPRERLAEAQRRHQVNDAAEHAPGPDDGGVALAIADGDISRALAGVFLDEYPSIRARYDLLAEEAIELRTEGQRMKARGLPAEPVAFTELVLKTRAWMERWRLFVAELSALGASLQ